MNRKALYAILIALIIPLLIFLYVNSLPKAAIPKPIFYDSVSSLVKNGKQVNDTSWHRIPDFTLTNQLGQTVSLKDLGTVSDNDTSRRVIVADFFYTHCPTICPAMTKNMKRLQNTVKKAVDADGRTTQLVQFISFSIDPGRDSVAALKKWADRFQVDPSNWWLVTGDKQTIYDLSLKHMNLAVQDPQIDSSFPHTDIFVLIDKNGVVRVRRDKVGNPVLYHGLDSSSLANLSEDIVLLSLEKDRKKKSFFEGQLTTIAVSMLIAFLLVGLFLFLYRKRFAQH
ncbi:MAG TPA: SCO family protein [Chitinophagaceae bacterium]|nr:SCO family protein [Chitinophagaceae bacterium]